VNNLQLVAVQAKNTSNKSNLPMIKSILHHLIGQLRSLMSCQISKRWKCKSSPLVY